MRLIRVFWRSATYERRFLTNNHWDLTMVVWIPLVTVLLIWWIFSQTQITNLPIGVVDQDNSPVANTVLRYLEASPDISIEQLYSSPAAAEAAILQRDIYAVVIIPEDFSKRILSSKPAPLVLQVNAQYGTHSGIIQKSVQSVAGTISAGVEIQRLIKQGMAPSQAAIAYSPISIQRISLFNAATNYQQFLASTVIPALLHILAMVIGATTIGRELRDQTLGNWYQYISSDDSNAEVKNTEVIETTSQNYEQSNTNNANGSYHDSDDDDNENRAAFSSNALVDSSNNALSPIKSASILVLVFGLLGKYFWPIVAYSLWSALALWLATPNQSIAITSYLAVFMGLILLMMLSFWLGAIFTLGSFSLRTGLSATGFISAPSYAFAGVTFPYIAISEGAKHWSDVLPLTHYLKLHIAQLQMGAPIAISLPIVYGLALAATVAMMLTALLTKRALTRPDKWGAR